MSQAHTKSQFKATLLRPAQKGIDTSWAFVILPKDVSQKLPRRGRTSVEGAINGQHFQITLEPDGQLSHWLQVSKELYKSAGANVGDIVRLEIMSVEQEPEPQVPLDFQEALAAVPEARKVWSDTTTVARLEWIHWITSAKQPKTRVKRIGDACDMLAAGKKRVCCFDQSGYYSKAFRAPETAA
jgi:Bacteriocin-protection, YdeI or OmpD-Associated/Domain of unknown function (DUF1905)